MPLIYVHHTEIYKNVSKYKISRQREFCPTYGLHGSHVRTNDKGNINVEKSVVYSSYKLSEMVAIRVTTLCSSVGGYRCFAGTRYVRVQDRNVFVFDPEQGGGIFIRNVDICLPNRAASLPSSSVS